MEKKFSQYDIYAIIDAKIEKEKELKLRISRRMGIHIKMC